MEELDVTNQVTENENLELSTSEETTQTSKTIELVDFSKLDTEDLIVAVKAIVDSAPIQTIKAQIDEAKKIFYDKTFKLKEMFQEWKISLRMEDDVEAGSRHKELLLEAII